MVELKTKALKMFWIWGWRLTALFNSLNKYSHRRCMHYLHRNYLCKLNLTMIHAHHSDDSLFIITLFFPKKANSWHHPDVSPPYQHLSMQIQKEFLIFTLSVIAGSHFKWSMPSGSVTNKWHFWKRMGTFISIKRRHNGNQNVLLCATPVLKWN